MNEELYTRDAPKKSSRRVEPENQTKTRTHSDKLKSETSAGESYRKKLRHGKKDNSITKEEAAKKAKLTKQTKKKVYADELVRRKARQSVTDMAEPEYERDDNAGIDALELGCGLTEAGLSKMNDALDKSKDSNYSGKMHARNEHLDAVQGKKGARAAGEAGEGSKSMAVKAAKKKQMQKEFAEHAYKKQAKEAANSFGNVAKRFTDKAEDLVGRLAEAVKEFIEDHPGLLLIIAIIFLVVLVLSGALTSCSAMMGGGGNLTIETSFTAQDPDIVAVEADYVTLETALQTTINNIPTNYPGYDEYNYTLAEICHNPFELAALLTVLYEDYTESEVQTMLQTIFDYQYTLDIETITETRTRTETRWHYVTYYRDEERTGYRWENGHLVPYTYTVSVPYQVYESYEVEVEYEYKILNATLTNSGISAAVGALNLTAEQMERYQLLLVTKGNKPDIFGDNPYASPHADPAYDNYSIPGEYMTDQQFANMINEAKRYLGYPYVWGGSNPSTSFDCSGFVSYVINNCGNGWNYGRLTANGLKNATARVSASDVKPGDLVFFQGTYETTGASHVGIVVDPVNKIMIHCGNPIQYASYDTTYWRAHAYCYGRIQ